MGNKRLMGLFLNEAPAQQPKKKQNEVDGGDKLANPDEDDAAVKTKTASLDNKGDGNDKNASGGTGGDKPSSDTPSGDGSPTDSGDDSGTEGGDDFDMGDGGDGSGDDMDGGSGDDSDPDNGYDATGEDDSGDASEDQFLGTKKYKLFQDFRELLELAKDLRGSLVSINTRLETDAERKVFASISEQLEDTIDKIRFTIEDSYDSFGYKRLLTLYLYLKTSIVTISQILEKFTGE